MSTVREAEGVGVGVGVGVALGVSLGLGVGVEAEGDATAEDAVGLGLAEAGGGGAPQPEDTATTAMTRPTTAAPPSHHQIRCVGTARAGRLPLIDIPQTIPLLLRPRRSPAGRADPGTRSADQPSDL
ncbi:MAG: hypothetical protein IT193_15105 [Propionibacteriaceae bacterium]|nr:hypothetical protein [Propionibacteriaceae bacterium]